jgi:hypothetical protein
MQLLTTTLFANPLSKYLIQRLTQRTMAPFVRRYEALTADAGSASLLMRRVLERLSVIERSVEDIVF